jgi:hypothetical protein
MRVQAVDGSWVTQTTLPQNPDAAAFASAVTQAQSTSTAQGDGPDYNEPVDWSAHAPSGSSHPGTDPLNVVISANSNVSMDELMQALYDNPSNPDIAKLWQEYIRSWVQGNPMDPQEFALKLMNAAFQHPTHPWQAVNTGDPGKTPIPVPPWSQGVGYEEANLDGHKSGQNLSAREGGLDTLTDSNIDHFRAWQQQSSGAWFIAASKEDWEWKVPDVWDSYHHVTSYDEGRDKLVADIIAAADAKGWTVTVRYVSNKTDTKPENGVGNDGRVAVITITKKLPAQA